MKRKPKLTAIEADLEERARLAGIPELRRQMAAALPKKRKAKPVGKKVHLPALRAQISQRG